MFIDLPTRIRLYLVVRAMLVLMLSIINANLVHAAIYKWVDDEGNTHYTQQPPPEGISQETIKPPAKIDQGATQEQFDQQQKFLDELRKARAKSAEEQQQSLQDAEQKRAECEQARARLASYQRPRVNLVNADGTRSRAPEEQPQQNDQLSFAD